jgi:hypothetical protein
LDRLNCWDAPTSAEGEPVIEENGCLQSLLQIVPTVLFAGLRTRRP